MGDFKVGDKVRHILRPQWGIGTVIEVDCGNCSYEVPANGKAGWADESLPCVSVLYPTFKGDQWEESDEPMEMDWYTFPHNLELVAE